MGHSKVIGNINHLPTPLVFRLIVKHGRVNINVPDIGAVESLGHVEPILGWPIAKDQILNSINLVSDSILLAKWTIQAKIHTKVLGRFKLNVRGWFIVIFRQQAKQSNAALDLGRRAPILDMNIITRRVLETLARQLDIDSVPSRRHGREFHFGFDSVA